MSLGDERTRFFITDARTLPYLSLWHQAFAPEQGSQGPLVELWFDRHDAPPLCEAVRLPERVDARTLEMTALYLAALINNKLCVWGAGRVSLVTRDEALEHDLLQRVLDLFLYRAERFSDLSLFFIFSLIEQRYGGCLVIDADREQVDRLARLAREPVTSPAPLRRPGRHTVLAVNIGQHKTACGLVTLDGAGGYALSRTQRQETWLEDVPHCYPDVAGQTMQTLAQQLGPLPPEVEAVCISLANPVIDGVPYGVSRVGLCATCTKESAADLGRSLRGAAQAAFPGLPVSLVNDAAAQGLFASRFCQDEPEPDGPGYSTNLLSIRFGACPSVSYIDAAGRNIPRMNEYGWLVTTIHGDHEAGPVLSTISRYLSFYGMDSIAQELGLSEKYGVEQQDAPACFHAFFTGEDAGRQRDAFNIYYVLGAHIAMLAHEIQRDTPVRHVQLLGSKANQLDEPVFTAIWNGFADFIDRHALPFDGVDFTLAEGTSAYASLVGAAVAYADSLDDVEGEQARRCLRRPGG